MFKILLFVALISAIISGVLYYVIKYGKILIEKIDRDENKFFDKFKNKFK